jgi:hypothetical protein
VQAQKWIWRFTAFSSMALAAGMAQAQALPQRGPPGRESLADVPPPPPLPPRFRRAADDKPPGPSFTPYTKRGLSTPQFFLLPSLKTTVKSLPPQEGAILGVDLGAALGLTDRIAVDATFVPIELAPKFRYGNPTFGVTYLVTETPPYDVAADVHVTFNTGRGSAIQPLEPGMLMVLRLKPDVRVDTGAYVPLTLGRRSSVDVRVPAGIAVQVTDHFHAGANTGITIQDITRPGRSAAIPFGLSAGFSTPVRKGMNVDVRPFISWPRFITPGGPETINSATFVVGVVSAVGLPPQ